MNDINLYFYLRAVSCLIVSLVTIRKDLKRYHFSNYIYPPTRPPNILFSLKTNYILLLIPLELLRTFGSRHALVSLLPSWEGYRP